MKAQIEQTSHDEAKGRNLVIADEPAFSRALSLILKGVGIDVCIAATGIDG